MIDNLIFFETSRLQVRKFISTDLDALDAMQRNPAVMKYVTGKPKPREETAKELEKYISSYDCPEPGFTVMAVDRKVDGCFIGTCAIIGNEVGFRLDEPCWGQGYGKELYAALVDYCFKQRQLGYLLADVDAENIASVRILETKMQLISSAIDETNGQLVKYYQVLNPDTIIE